jgi:hypothetical protein
VSSENNWDDRARPSIARRPILNIRSNNRVPDPIYIVRGTETWLEGKTKERQIAQLPLRLGKRAAEKRACIAQTALAITLQPLTTKCRCGEMADATDLKSSV